MVGICSWLAGWCLHLTANQYDDHIFLGGRAVSSLLVTWLATWLVTGERERHGRERRAARARWEAMAKLERDGGNGETRASVR
jgi:hypothetical protein